MIHVFAAYKRFLSNLWTLTDWKQGEGKRHFMQIEIKAGVAILIDEIDLKTVKRDKQPTEHWRNQRGNK